LKAAISSGMRSTKLMAVAAVPGARPAFHIALPHLGRGQGEVGKVCATP
jgi:hypothetical protein